MTEYKLKVRYDPDDQHYYTSIGADNFTVTGVGCSRMASILEAAFSLDQELDWEILDSDRERVVLEAAHADPEFREKVRKAVEKVKKERD